MITQTNEARNSAAFAPSGERDPEFADCRASEYLASETICLLIMSDY
jgi:hypothetical protein